MGLFYCEASFKEKFLPSLGDLKYLGGKMLWATDSSKVTRTPDVADEVFSFLEAFSLWNPFYIL